MIIVYSIECWQFWLMENFELHKLPLNIIIHSAYVIISFQGLATEVKLHLIILFSVFVQKWAIHWSLRIMSWKGNYDNIVFNRRVCVFESREKNIAITI